MMIRATENTPLARIGLLSDSHGRAATTQRAVQLLLEQKIDLLLHLGDVGNVDVIDAMIEQLDEAGDLDPKLHTVFGNCDWDADAMARYADSLGVSVDHPVGRLSIDGKTLVFQHGHQEAAMDQALAEGVDYLCHGHTHAQRDERVGSTRVINPGALFRAAEYTVAVLDVAKDDLQFFAVPEV